MSTDPESTGFAPLLRRVRIAAGLTQEALAERSGLGTRTIQDLERGAHHPLDQTLRQLTRALALSGEQRSQFEAVARARPRQPRVIASVPRYGAVPLDQTERSAPRHNLPIQVTSFVGRKRELAEVKRLLAETHLLTLTGAGGCGKTRLALEAAGEIVGAFPDGVWLIELAPLVDPVHVPAAVAVVLGVRESPGQAIEVAVFGALRTRHLLLVLDNCEHLIDVCAHLADAMMQSCPEVRILATSREALGIAGEVGWHVPSLTVPPLKSHVALDTLAATEAVQLFVDRAVAIRPTFSLTEHNGAVVAQICRQLDGIPLAVELAATRVKSLSVEQIAARLDQRFHLLTVGSRVALPRLQTLMASVEWSYDLLTEPQRALFNRLAVFVGGFTLDAAEAIGDDETRSIRADVLNLLSELVDKSLVTADFSAEGEERYRLLETLRQYGRERLEAIGEVETLQRRHAAYYLRLALKTETYLAGPRQRDYLARLDLEIDNLRAALRWYLDRGLAQAGLQLTLALLRFWWFRGGLSENRAWLDQFLGLPGDAERTALRATALAWAGTWSRYEGDHALWRALMGEAIAIAREVGDPRAVAEALLRFGTSANSDEARKPLEESLGLFRTLGDPWKISLNLGVLARMTHAEGDPAQARVYVTEAMALARKVGERHAISFSLEVLGEITIAEHEAQARAYLEESLALNQEAGDLLSIASVENFLGRLEIRYGCYSAARDHYRASLHLARDWPWTGQILQSLDGLAIVAAGQGQAERALRLAGASAHLRKLTVIQAPPFVRAELQRALDPIRQAIGASIVGVLWSEGETMTREQAVACALEEIGGDRVALSPSGFQFSNSLDEHIPTGGG